MQIFVNTIEGNSQMTEFLPKELWESNSEELPSMIATLQFYYKVMHT